MTALLLSFIIILSCDSSITSHAFLKKQQCYFNLNQPPQNLSKLFAKNLNKWITNKINLLIKVSYLLCDVSSNSGQECLRFTLCKFSWERHGSNLKIIKKKGKKKRINSCRRFSFKWPWHRDIKFNITERIEKNAESNISVITHEDKWIKRL